MGEWNLEQEYESLLRASLEAGTVTRRTNQPEFRATPRFRIPGGNISVRVEPRFQLLDVSAGGIAFLSERSFPVGSVLQLILHGTVAFQARVVDCPVVETDATLLEARYRVQCKFDSPATGKHMLLLYKEMEQIGDLPGAN